MSEYANENSLKWLSFWEQICFFLNKEAPGLHKCRKAKSLEQSVQILWSSSKFPCCQLVCDFLNLLKTKQKSKSFAFYPKNFINHNSIHGFGHCNMLPSYNSVSHLPTQYLFFQEKNKKWNKTTTKHNQTENFSGEVISM